MASAAHCLRREDHCRGAGETRQAASSLAERGLTFAPGRPTQAGSGSLPLRLGQVADLHQRVDEETQSEFRRQRPCRGVRRIDQPYLLEIGHHIAHGCRRSGIVIKREILRDPTVAGGEIVLDNLPENIARTLVELRQPRVRRDQIGPFGSLPGKIGLRSSVVVQKFAPSLRESIERISDHQRH